MSTLNSVINMQNQTALMSNGAERNVGGAMGKHDFLMLLSAQLRHQDPLEPQSDSDFAAGLAQFSALEQMQNMNNTLLDMTAFQAYSLVGKHVIAETVIDGRAQQIAGPVDSVFTRDGVAYASVNGREIPLSDIREVFDSSNFLTAAMLHNTSNNLIGRIVIAEYDGEEIEGFVTRVLVDRGDLLAQIEISHGEYVLVPVNTIVDIRVPGSDRFEPKPQTPPDAVNFRPDGDGFIETNEDGTVDLGRWDWNADTWRWVLTKFEGDQAAD